MFHDFLLAAGSVSLGIAGIATFFWLVVTYFIRRVNKGEFRQTLTQKEEDLEKLIDEEVAAIRSKSGKTPPPPITS